MEYEGKIRVYRKEDYELSSYYNASFYNTLAFELNLLWLIVGFTFRPGIEIILVLCTVTILLLYFTYTIMSKKRDKILDSFTNKCTIKIQDDFKALVTCDSGDKYIIYLYHILRQGTADSKYDTTTKVTRIFSDEFPILGEDGLKSKVCYLLVYGEDFCNLLKSKGFYIQGMEI